jgi:hypothetical protein
MSHSYRTTYPLENGRRGESFFEAVSNADARKQFLNFAKTHTHAGTYRITRLDGKFKGAFVVEVGNA